MAKARKSIPVRIGDLILRYLFLTILVLFLVGSILILVSFRSRNDSGIYFLLYEIGRAIVVTAVVGGGVNWYLASVGGTKTQQNIDSTLTLLDHRLEEQVESFGAIAKAGIARIYENRSAALDDIKTDITNSDLKTLKVLGISLHELLGANTHASLYHEWKKIVKRVSTGGQDAPVVKILLIDPGCHGARMRAGAESRRTRAPSHLEHDVIEAIRTLRSQRRQAPKLSARLYRTAPILWLVQTDRVTYLEQYHFWPEHDPDLNVPVLRYENVATSEDEPESMHKQLEGHFDYVWDCAKDVDDYEDHADVGCDDAIDAAGVTNIFFDQSLARKRLISLIGRARTELWIKGVTLHSYLVDGDLKQALEDAIERNVRVRLLIIDPDNTLAKMRAFREYQLRHPAAKWVNFDSYCDEVLYKDVELSIKEACEIKKETRLAKKHFETRIYSSGPECFMLLNDDSVVVEQYHYGKIAHEETRIVLGGEVPLVEYKNRAEANEKNVYMLFRDHFDYVFRNFAVDAVSRNQKSAINGSSDLVATTASDEQR